MKIEKQGLIKSQNFTEINNFCSFQFSKLPSEYQRLDYLESDGTQYIDTGFKVNVDNFKLKTEVYIKNSNIPYASVFGSDPQSGITMMRYSDTSDWRIEFHGNYDIAFTPIIEVWLPIDIDLLNNTVTIGSTLLTDLNASGISSQNFLLFAKPLLDGPIDHYSSSRIKRIRMGNGSYAMDLIPCYRKNDNKPGFYDAIGNNFYTNAGSSEFIMGNIIPNSNNTINSNNFYEI